jgi:hypothetical protein
VGSWVSGIEGRQKAEVFRKFGVTNVVGPKGEKVRSFMVIGSRKILSV